MNVAPVRHLSSPALSAVQVARPLSLGRIFAFVLLNVILAYLSRQSSLFSTLYGVVVFAIGLHCLGDKEPTRLIYLCSYIVGAELIWRSTNSRLFYEYGKYAVAFLLILALLKFRLLDRANRWPLLYFLFLLPSIVVLPRFDREALSFFLSGPFLLTVAVMFFTTVELKAEHVKRVIVAMIGPTVGIATLALYSTFSAQNLVFTDESNFITSGGFGPVQISSQLGFGALLAFYYAISEKRNRAISSFMLMISVWLLSQSLFTFSRSGLYISLVALLVGSVFLLRENRQGMKLVAGGAIAVTLMLQVIFPILNNFTGGKLLERFQDTGSSGRDVLIRADWQAFLENPVFGVGPGQAYRYHILIGRATSSHTEYTRLLAEHGIFGLIAMMILVGLALNRLLKKMTLAQKGLVMLLTTWALFYMLSTTMRTAAPGFVFGLGGAIFSLDNQMMNEK